MSLLTRRQINPVVAGQHPKRDHRMCWTMSSLTQGCKLPWCSVHILVFYGALELVAQQQPDWTIPTDSKGTRVFICHLMSCIRSLLAEAKGCCSEATIKAAVTHSEGTLLNFKSRIKNTILFVLPKCSRGRKILYLMNSEQSVFSIKINQFQINCLSKLFSIGQLS